MYFGFTLAVFGGAGGPSHSHSRSPRGRPPTFLQWPLGMSAVLQASLACLHPTWELAAHCCAPALTLNSQTTMARENHHRLPAFSFLLNLRFQLDIQIFSFHRALLDKQ